MAFFADFPWPGNVRQLKHCIESALNFTENGQGIGFSALPPYLFETPAPVERLEPVKPREEVRQTEKNEMTVMETIHAEEKAALTEALKKTQGNMAAAARRMGISRQSFVYRVKKYGLK